MILAQAYDSHNKSISDNLLAHFGVYNGVEDLAHSRACCPAPVTILNAFDANCTDVDLPRLGWVDKGAWGIYVPAVRVVFLDDAVADGSALSPTIRYWCADGWYTAKEVVAKLEA